MAKLQTRLPLVHLKYFIFTLAKIARKPSAMASFTHHNRLRSRLLNTDVRRLALASLFNGYLLMGNLIRARLKSQLIRHFYFWSLFIVRLRIKRAAGLVKSLLLPAKNRHIPSFLRNRNRTLVITKNRNPLTVWNRKRQ